MRAVLPTADDALATATHEVERRLGVLAAEPGIGTVVAACLAARDHGSAGDEIAALFAHDGIWEGAGPDGARLGRHRGRRAIARRFPRDRPPTLHLIGGGQIRDDGDAAGIAGVYDNDFVRHGGRWRFAHVRVEPVLVAAHRHGWASLIRADGHGERASA